MDIQKEFKSVKKSRIFNNLLKIYSLDEKKVLDIGCAKGEHLVHFGEGSKGVDANKKYFEFWKELNLKVITANVENNIPLNEKFDVIWCNNLIEHLVAPHLFLVRLHKFLKENSILILGVPTVSPISFLRRFSRFRGYLAHEHLNFFTQPTIKLTLERAGYKIEEARLFYFRNRLLDKLLSPISPHLYLICRKVKDFQYHPKRLEVFIPKFQKQ